ncbi:MAG: hypothetical protein ACE14S_04660 [Candidatus Bathyarchaeia archaeon]
MVANVFIWYLYSGRFLTEITGASAFSSFETSVVWGVNVLGTATAAVLGVSLAYRVRQRIRFLRYWLLAGITLSLAPLAFDVTGFTASAVFFTLVGVYFGLGMPVSLGYFAASTQAENRSRQGGLAFLIIFASLFLLGALRIDDVALNAVVLAACEAVTLALTFGMKLEEREIGSKDKVSYRNIVTNKAFLLYFVPWMMFSAVNFVTLPVVNEIFPELFEYSGMVENLLAAMCAVICGFLGDYIGRKRVVLGGFALLGLGYASLGLFTDSIVGWWFYTAVDGVAWGAFYAIFLMAIWGDIAQRKSSEKYYTLGYLPFVLSVYTQLSIGTSISSAVFKTAVFSFASVFLFLAVLPLAYAPETLPEKAVKDRELRDYLEKAMRAKTQSDAEAAR